MLALAFDWIIRMRNHSNASTKDLPDKIKQVNKQQQKIQLFFLQVFLPWSLGIFFFSEREDDIR